MSEFEGVVRTLADGFAQAALRPELWMSAIEDMASATRSERGELVGFGPKGRLFNWVSVIDEEVMNHFLSFDHSNPRVNFRIGANQGARSLEVVHEAHYDAVMPTLINQDYVEFCRRWDMMNGCQSQILATDDSFIGLSVLRTERDGRTTEEQRRLFGALCPHVLAAVRMQTAIENQGFQLLTGAMDAMGAAAFALDAKGLVKGLSPSAEKLVSQADRLRLARGRLRGATASDEATLQRCITAATKASLPGFLSPPPSDAQSIAVLYGADSHSDPLIIDVLPLPEAPWSLGFQPRVLVVARGSEKSADQTTPLLINAFGLTEAEAAIAEQLAKGVSRETIAERRGVTLVTIRTQIRSIFRKAGVSREAELVAKVNALLA